MNIVSAVILCTIVGAIGAVVLVLAAKFMAVEEDPRIEEVSACLAGANCGGCGYAGCADYAKAVVMDGVPCDKCAPGGPKAAAAIAKIMGGEASAVEKKAVVQCQGNSRALQAQLRVQGHPDLCRCCHPVRRPQDLYLCLHRPGRLHQGV